MGRHSRQSLAGNCGAGHYTVPVTSQTIALLHCQWQPNLRKQELYPIAASIRFNPGHGLLCGWLSWLTATFMFCVNWRFKIDQINLAVILTLTMTPSTASFGRCLELVTLKAGSQSASWALRGNTCF